MNRHMSTSDHVKDDEYSKRRTEFTDKLLAFHRMKGNPIRRFPLLGGRELDLYHLYTKVKQLGGSYVVTKERNWGEVSRSFNLPSTVTSASYACRQNYLKFLQEYEQMELQGSTFDPANYVTRTTPPVRQSRIPQPTPPTQSTPTPPVNARLSRNSFSTLSSHLPNLLALPGLQGLGNLLDQLSKAPNQLQVLSNMLQLPPNQIQLLELLMHQHQQRQQSRVLDNTRTDWLVRSLQSGFPNEIDFSLNSLLIMSSDNKGVLPLNGVPQLIDVLLAHVGVFCEDDPYLEILYREEWHSEDNQDYHRMWLEITPEYLYYTIIDDLNCQDAHFSHLFPSQSVMSEDNTESIRVSQVAMVIRNFSFDEINAMFLASHEGTLKFLLLGINCSLPTIQSLCLDTLTNITPHLQLNPTAEEEDLNDNSISCLLMSTLQELVLSNDRLCVIRAIECIGSLAYSTTNIPFLILICCEVYLRMLQCLLLPDVQLVLTCLDALYCLTFYGRIIGEKIINCNNCISILIRMIAFRFDSTSNIVQGISLIHTDGNEEIVTTTTSSRKAKDKKQVSNASTPQRDASISPPVSMTTSTPLTITATPLHQKKVSKNPSNRFPATKVDDNKIAFGKQWLNRFYEPHKEEFVSKREVYSKYLNSCANLKLLTAASQAEFDLILKETFPDITFTSVKLSGQDVQLVGGIGKKPVSAQNQPTTAITQPATTITQPATTITQPATTITQPATTITQPVTTINQPVTTITQPVTTINQQQSTKSNSVSRGSSPTPSRSPSPSSLSPLQQLIQQTKIKTLSIPLSSAKSSPLLVSNKMNRPNQVIKTGITSDQLSDTSSCSSGSDLVKFAKMSNGICVSSINGNASEEEKRELLNYRKRPFDDDDDIIVRKVPRTECENSQRREVTSVDTTMLTCSTTTPTCSTTTPTCSTTTPTHIRVTPPTCTTTTPTNSSFSSNTSTDTFPASRLVTSSIRSTSLPPSLNKTNQRIMDKARSLTPPVIPPLIDTINPVKPVSATSTTSLPGGITSNISRDSRAVCLWKNCLEIRSSFDDLFYHVMYDHLSSVTMSTYSLCEWTGCPSKAKRMLPSLSRHVQTHHCSSSHKPVSPNVALTLMKLRAVPNWEIEDESLITKSVRLTAALVLRNLLETVPVAKSYVSVYESRLVQVALSASEASNTVAQCLSLLTSCSSDPLPSPTKQHLNPL